MNDVATFTRVRLRVGTLLFTAMLLGGVGSADGSAFHSVWSSAGEAALQEIGRGVAVVFSPDLSVRGNCRVYAALGFLCIEETDWRAVVDAIATFNAAHPEHPVRTVVLETHGTNGHGLKLQRDARPRSARSYISVGGLRERLGAVGVGSVILGACNAGRLLRPEIHRELDPHPGDKLFLPATSGIYGASPSYDPDANVVEILTPPESQVEMTIVASVAELSERTRRVFAETSGEDVDGAEFVVSDLMMRMILRDRDFELRRGEATAVLSRRRSTPDESERLFNRLVARLDAAAARSGGARFAQPVMR